MKNSIDIIREFAEKQFPLSKELKKEVLYNQIQQAKQNECFSDLTALISEGYVSREEHEADIEFLARRQQKAGGISFTEERETGISSNSIVAIAYGIVKLADQSFPYDWSDLNACRNMWKKLPEHRKVGDALIAMQQAEAAIKNTEKK